jgi:hypothetical protein
MKDWSTSFKYLSRKFSLVLAEQNVHTNCLCSFGPQKIHNAAEKIMKWREVQEPHSSPILAPGATPAILSPGREREKDTNPMSGMDEKRLSQQTVEAASPSGSAISTPKPSSRKSLAHVLIVDDNEINVKV